LLGFDTKGQLAEKLERDKGVPMCGACILTDFSSSQFYFSSKRDDREVTEALQELAFKHPSYESRSFSLISEGQVSSGTTRSSSESTSF
jgi:putative transposase